VRRFQVGVSGLCRNFLATRSMIWSRATAAGFLGVRGVVSGMRGFGKG
jgi:hypothetical protein